MSLTDDQSERRIVLWSQLLLWLEDLGFKREPIRGLETDVLTHSLIGRLHRFNYTDYTTRGASWEQNQSSVSTIKKQTKLLTPVGGRGLSRKRLSPAHLRGHADQIDQWEVFLYRLWKWVLDKQQQRRKYSKERKYFTTNQDEGAWLNLNVYKYRNKSFTGLTCGLRSVGE